MCAELGGVGMSLRRRLLEIAKNIAGGEAVVQGSFTVTEETNAFTVTGLGFEPTNIIVNENEFEAIKKRTSCWISTDAFSAIGRYQTDTAANPAILNTATANNNTFVELFEDGFTVKQASNSYPIAAKNYNYIVW